MALMGLDNIEWAASILDEANKIKTKKRIKS
jgi:SNF2 family DNA or RNA helicase